MVKQKHRPQSAEYGHLTLGAGRVADAIDYEGGEVERDLRALRHDIDDALEARLDKVTDVNGLRRSERVLLARNAITKMGHGLAQSRALSSEERMRRMTRKAVDSSAVAALRMQGMYIWEIAELLGVSETTIKGHLQKVRELWLSSAVIDFNERKAEEVAKIDYLERKNWETIREVNVLADEREEGMTELDFRRIKAAQDAIMWCIVQRTKIFGLEAPVKVDWKIEAQKYGIDADKMYHALVKEFTDQIIDAEVVKPMEIAVPEGGRGAEDEEMEGDYDEGDEGSDDDGE